MEIELKVMLVDAAYELLMKEAKKKNMPIEKLARLVLSGWVLTQEYKEIKADPPADPPKCP